MHKRGTSCQSKSLYLQPLEASEEGLHLAVTGAGLRAQGGKGRCSTRVAFPRQQDSRCTTSVHCGSMAETVPLSCHSSTPQIIMLTPKMKLENPSSHSIVLKKDYLFSFFF